MSDADLKAGYDRVAPIYADRVYDELAGKPLDRELLDRLAEIAGPTGRVCDLGCGPGHVGGYLRGRGVDVVGLDPSAGMLAEARRRDGEMPLVRGALPDLPFADGSLAGAAAMYSIIHVPRERLPAAFADIRRALGPGGTLLLGFHLGDCDIHLEEWWGHAVAIDFLFFGREEIESHLAAADLAIERSLERDPYPDVEHQSRRAYILARRPE